MRVGEVDLELVEGRHGTWREAVATHLVAPLLALFEDPDRGTATRCSDRRGSTGGPAADDEQIARLHGHQPAVSATDIRSRGSG